MLVECVWAQAAIRITFAPPPSSRRSSGCKSASAFTSRDSATQDSGNVVNEVAYTYDGLGQLTKEEQEHDGAVDGSTLSVQYAYDTSASASSNYTRLDYMTYPNGRTIYARYTNSDAANNKQDEIAAGFGRIGQFAESSSTDVYAEYTFAGMSRLVKRDSQSGSGWKGNDTVLNYDSGTSDEYAGFDFDGRVVDQLTENDAGDETREEIQYTANRDGSPKIADRKPAVMASRSDLYTYDDLHRLTKVTSGLMHTDQTQLAADFGTPSEVSYTMDVLGNITTLDRKDSGTSATETRVYNATNELTSRTVNGEAVRYLIDDEFSDDDIQGWEVADLDGDGTTGGGDDGTWAASSGAMSCTAVITESGAPDSGEGSLLRIRTANYQDIRLSASATLTTGCENIGLVFGYVDEDNFFAKIYSLTQQKWLLYEVSSGTWTLRDSSSFTITSGAAFQMDARVHAGSASGYGATVPAGYVGLWCSDSSNNAVDWFKVHDVSGTYVAGPGWRSQQGDADIESGQFKIKQSGTDVAGSQAAVYMPFRGEKYTAEFDFVWQADTNNKISPGCAIHLQNFSNYMAVYIQRVTDKVELRKVVDDHATTVKTSGSAYSLTDGQTYTMQIEIGDDPNTASLQRLRVKVDTDQRIQKMTKVPNELCLICLLVCGLATHRTEAAIVTYSFEHQRAAIAGGVTLPTQLVMDLQTLGALGDGVASGHITLDTSVAPVTANGLDLFSNAVVAMEVQYGALTFEAFPPALLFRHLGPSGSHDGEPETLALVGRPSSGFMESPPGIVEATSFFIQLTAFGGTALPPGASLAALLDRPDLYINSGVNKILDDPSAAPVILGTAITPAIPEPCTLPAFALGMILMLGLRRGADPRRRRGRLSM